MFARDHKELLARLMREYCMDPGNIDFVSDVAAWCKREGVPEPDPDKPLKLVSLKAAGCRLVVMEQIPDDVIEERINALRVRSALLNVARDRANALNSERKKLAYLFLNEYASTLPDIGDDEIMVDETAFKEMTRLGFFRE